MPELKRNLAVQDPMKRHELERKDVKELVCALCNTQQPVSTQCQQCHVTFGVYSCMECIFFDDETAKKQFHCDDCGICRVGGKEKFFHCQTCGCCYDKKLQVCNRASEHLLIHAFALQLLYILDGQQQQP